MEDKTAVYREYCTGCGLCHSCGQVAFGVSADGFPVPELTEKDIPFCKRVCPAGGRSYGEADGVWGPYRTAELAWACDETVRTRGSSGGVLTAVCRYLLSSGQVDGIIQTKAGDPAYGTVTVVSKTPEEVLACAGSRYSVSSPLMDIRTLAEPGKRFAFVGKPCDVSALRALLEEDGEMRERIPYLLSFFCAGMPGLAAQKKLLEKLNCPPDECTDLQYRGNGWPGFATAVRGDGTETGRMTYEDSWGTILGRDVRKCCRFCLDGVGEAADLACGDAWYLLPDGTPDFSEHEGRNMVFARTEAGEKLLREAEAAGVLTVTPDEEYLAAFDRVQAYQKARKATMGAMTAALKLCGRPVPAYDRKRLARYAKMAGTKLKARRFLGTLKRVKSGSI